MYDIVSGIIQHVWVTNDSMQQYVVYVCCVLIPVLTVCLIDLTYRVFRHFWRR